MPDGTSGRSLAQQRVRLIVLRDSEKIKLKALMHQSEVSDADSLSIYEELIAAQQKKIVALERKILQLTDRLEAPALRLRLKQVETSVEKLSHRILQQQKHLQELKQQLTDKDTDIEKLSTQLHNLQDLNIVYVKQIALLSLHERQNSEDHANAVLLVSQHLSERGLPLPAKASAKVLDKSPFHQSYEEVEDLAANPCVDQTIFSKSLRTGERYYLLSLVISSITADVETQPIEIKLTEFDALRQNHQTKLLNGFPVSSAILAAETFANVYQTLTAQAVEE